MLNVSAHKKERYENAKLNKWISQESKATSRTKVSRQN
jgi:hypothetical protein